MEGVGCDSVRVFEPGLVFSVLTLELTVVLRMAWRSVKEQNAMVAEH
jgi:hypothetical protein